MEITGNKVSQYLESIDRFMDRWGLSPINNLVNCVTKICMRIYRCYYADEGKFKAEREKAFLGHYFNYIDKKDGEMCVVGLVPLLGSILICDYNKTCENKRKLYKDMTLDIPRTPVLVQDEDFGSPNDIVCAYDEEYEPLTDERRADLSGDFGIEVTAPNTSVSDYIVPSSLADPETEGGDSGLDYELEAFIEIDPKQ